MGFTNYLRQLWKKPSPESNQLFKQRLIIWRKEPVTLKISRPTRLERARTLGYKAKPGILVVRQRLKRGGRKRPTIKKGRRSKHARQRKVLAKNYQQVAEERVNRKFINCEVVGSYYVAKDGNYYWFEVIVADRAHPVVRSSTLGWVAAKQNRGRAFRGLTSAGRRSRGLHKKGKGVEKARPSHRAHGRRQN